MKIFVVFLFTISSAFGSSVCKMVDLTHNLNNDGITYPIIKKYRMEVLQNGTTPQGFWLQLENISGGTHIGTHIDAPCVLAEGGTTIENIPLEKLVCVKAAIIDITEKAERNPDAKLTVKDLKRWEKCTGCKLDNHIVVLHSNWSYKYPNPELFLGTPTSNASDLHFPGFCCKAAKFLVKKRNIIAVGTDTSSVDYGPSQDFIANRIFFSHNKYTVQFLKNLDKLPICGAKFHILPMKLENACGSPSRIYATVGKSSHCCGC